MRKKVPEECQLAASEPEGEEPQEQAFGKEIPVQFAYAMPEPGRLEPETRRKGPNQQPRMNQATWSAHTHEMGGNRCISPFRAACGVWANGLCHVLRRRGLRPEKPLARGVVAPAPRRFRNTHGFENTWNVQQMMRSELPSWQQNAIEECARRTSGLIRD